MAKFDLSRAWDSAKRMLTGNRELALVVGGIFFFLPLFAALLAIFGSDIEFLPKGAEPDPDKVAQAIEALIAQYWWMLVGIGLLQIFGTITLLRILALPSRPTVGEALRQSALLLLPLIGAQLLSSLAIQLLPTLQTALLGDGAASAVAGLIITPVTLYLWIKFSLISPLVAVDEIKNPVQALRRSWQLTKGNSLRIFGFFVLLFVAGVLVFLTVGLVAGLGLALLGDQGSMIGSALFLAASVTIGQLLGLAVVAAVHRQLSTPSNT